MQDLQLVAERCTLQGLKGAGIVRGDVEDMLQRRVAALFMPHGRCLPLLLLYTCLNSAEILHMFS